MKAKILFPLVAVALMLGFSACGDDDDDIKPSKVPVEVNASFNEDFPRATNVSWEKKANYYVADFDEGALDKDAWYTFDGQLQMTVTDYERNDAVLPSAIKDVLQSDQYSVYILDDIEYYERPADSFYVIDMENIDTDIDFIFSPNGTLLNSINDRNNDYIIYPNTDVTKL